MKNKIAPAAIAASILIITGLLVWPSNPGKGITSLTLLSQAYAAEQTVFSGQGIIYLVNEFTLTPVPENAKFSKRLEELENALAKNDLEKANAKNIETLKAWFSYSWFPFYSLGADGQLNCLQLEPAGAKSCVVTEKIWYDTATGRFVRTMETNGTVIFANAFDGQNVYSSFQNNDGSLGIAKESADVDFKTPQNPADFLGMGVGITNAFSRKNDCPPIVNVSEESLDQTQVRVYKLGFTDIEECTATYYLFKVGFEDNIIREIQCIVDNQPAMNLKRISTQSVSAPDLSWDLHELDEKKMPAMSDVVAIRSVESKHLSVEQMIQKADFETYLFSANPGWTSEGQIHSGPDQGSGTSRMFAVIYPAADGRHVILSQMPSLNRYHAGIHKKMEEMGRPWPPSYTSPNECGMYKSDGKSEKSWTEFAIKASGFEPAQNRCGVIIRTPAETYLALAVNGPVSDEEFHSLVDSLVPAREYKH